MTSEQEPIVTDNIVQVLERELSALQLEKDKLVRGIENAGQYVRNAEVGLGRIGQQMADIKALIDYRQRQKAASQEDF